MQENSVHKVGFVITHKEDGQAKVLLTKTKPGQWRFPDTFLSIATPACDKEMAEPFRNSLNAGGTSYISSVFYRDSEDGELTTRFYALKCTTPDIALVEIARVLDCETRWASFEEASWIVVAPQLDVALWGERLLFPKNN